MFNLREYCFSLYLVLWCQQSISALEITYLHVPRGATHEALLDCRYTLENSETLYDVKWYKDGEEFFRCKANGSILQFPVEGVKLYASNLARQGSCPLTLTGLTNRTSGDYSCEVSLDYPTFKIVQLQSRLTVYSPPPTRRYKVMDRFESQENQIDEPQPSISGSKPSSAACVIIRFNSFWKFVLLSCLATFLW